MVLILPERGFRHAEPGESWSTSIDGNPALTHTPAAAPRN